jgi:hypothetical protein
MSPWVAVSTIRWGTILQNLSNFAFNRDTDFASWIWLSKWSTILAVSSFQLDLGGDIAWVSHTFSCIFALFVVWSEVGTASFLVTPFQEEVSSIITLISNAASEQSQRIRMLEVIASFAGSINVEVIGHVVASILYANIAGIINVIVVFARLASSFTIFDLTILASFINTRSLILVRESLWTASLASSVNELEFSGWVASNR